MNHGTLLLFMQISHSANLHKVRSFHYRYVETCATAISNYLESVGRSRDFPRPAVCTEKGNSWSFPPIRVEKVELAVECKQRGCNTSSIETGLI